MVLQEILKSLSGRQTASSIIGGATEQAGIMVFVSVRTSRSVAPLSFKVTMALRETSNSWQSVALPTRCSITGATMTTARRGIPVPVSGAMSPALRA